MPIHVTTSTTQSISNKTFVDYVSTTGVVFAQGGDSNQWNSSYTTVNANSGNWGYQGTDIKSLTSNWESTYTTVQSNSATNWNYQGTDIKGLTANWENTYTDFSGQSANNISVFSTVNANSGAWGSGGGSGIDTEVRALTANWESTYSSVSSTSGNWNSTYSTVNSNSATTWNYQGTDIKALTSNWENTYTNFSTQSANNISVYSTVQTNSGSWGGGGNTAVDTLVTTTSGNWNSVYSTVNSNSGTWGGGGGGGSAGWTLIATSSANNNTNIVFDDVFTDAYDHYMVTVYQAKCTSSGNNLNMYWRLNGTDVKLDTTGSTHLFYGGNIYNEGNSNSTGYGHKLTYFGRTFSGTNQSSNGFATFQPRLLEVKNVAFEMKYFETTSGPIASLLRGYSTMAAPSAMTGCGFAFFSGNISTGVFAVYGLKKTL